MREDNLLDDFNLEEAATGELLAVAGKLSKWLLPMATISIIAASIYCISGVVAFFEIKGLPALFFSFLLIGQGVIWGNAARWQLKFMKWTKRVASYDTAYDQEHWVYLNFKLWQWLALSLISSFLILFLLGVTGF